MDKLSGNPTCPANLIHWLSEELFLALHQELSSLIRAQIKREDIAADIASQCLVDLWVAAPQGADFFLIQSFLLHRVSKLISNYKKELTTRAIVEQHYYRTQQTNLLNENAGTDTINCIRRWVPLLEPSEQEMLYLLLEQQLDLEQISLQLDLPLSSIRRLYKHAIFRLRKAMGQWSRYQ